MEEVMKAKNDSVRNKVSRKRILLLGGSGKVGVWSALKLVASDLVSEVGIAGRNLERLDRAVSKIGNKAHAVQVDILDEHRLVSVAADYDIILNTAGPEHKVRLPALRGAIAAGKHYCDNGGEGPTVEQQLELDSMAKERDIVAIPGIGSSALFNLLALLAYKRFDRTEEIQICHYAKRYFLEQVNSLQ
jgi:saccharopine dehydrogenase-like NADP-dependent oxidoreductase